MQPKAYRGLGMEGQIARWYARNTGKNLDDIRSLAARIAERLTRGSHVLEIAPGPGYLAIEIAKAGKFNVTGLDISRTFVEIARQNARMAGVTVDFRQGDAAHLSLDSDSFEFLVCRAAFKNFSEPVLALKEMHRVLAPGGTALIIDLRKNASRHSINQAVDEMRLSAVNSLLTKSTFRFMLLKRAYTRENFQAFIAASGFQDVDIQDTLIGFEIWLRK